MSGSDGGAVSLLEYHVLLALAGAPLYGYAITEAVECESRGAIVPRAGTLYRVLARLVSRGFIREKDHGEESHPGRARRWYALTPAGRHALSEESQRLGAVAELALQRLGTGRP
ncbi:MAG: PadR family transcriptional regulator [Longimicrobiales bacterium]|nr:PadR family transcriptional regulator [Longimicrobiales bacterium]